MRIMQLSTAAFAATCSYVLLAATLVSAWDETPSQVAHRSRALLTDSSTFGVGILSTIYPADYPVEELRGFVTSGSDYFAPCYANGDLVVLALPVSSNWKNALTSPGKNATITVISNPDPQVPDPRHTNSKGKWDSSRPNWRRGMYSKQRLTLFGHLEEFPNEKADSKELQDCYLSYHPDASHFIPGSHDSPHLAIWTTFIVDKVYRVGGYGDESQIGWLELERWQKAGRSSEPAWWKEWEAAEVTSTHGTSSTLDIISHADSDRIAALFSDNESHGHGNHLVFQI